MSRHAVACLGISACLLAGATSTAWAADRTRAVADARVVRDYGNIRRYVGKLGSGRMSHEAKQRFLATVEVLYKNRDGSFKDRDHAPTVRFAGGSGIGLMGMLKKIVFGAPSKMEISSHENRVRAEGPFPAFIGTEPQMAAVDGTLAQLAERVGRAAAPDQRSRMGLVIGDALRAARVNGPLAGLAAAYATAATIRSTQDGASLIGVIEVQDAGRRGALGAAMKVLEREHRGFVDPKAALTVVETTWLWKNTAIGRPSIGTQDVTLKDGTTHSTFQYYSAGADGALFWTNGR
ncbi:MAG: hypothetical protein IT371_03110 [Deltaproteobacteria bacterium]|nr:hypothetical protein [Deltaproteobacteria bacterium]